MPIVVRCPAKLNLFLEVVGKRADGYHELDTVMQAVSLWDELRIEPIAGEELSLECSDPSLPRDGGNLVVRAALALRGLTGCRRGARLALAKRIPTQAGLGGGSSDAAGALLGLNWAWGLELSRDELCRVAAEVGSDVAFFLYGGTARCTGRGEVVAPLVFSGTFHYIVVCPPWGVSTGDAYRRLGALTYRRASASILVGKVRAGNTSDTGRLVYNRLEEAAFGLRPELRQLKQRLVDLGVFAGVAMTGSGSAIFGLCVPEDWERARQLCTRLDVGYVHAVRSIEDGVAIAARSGSEVTRWK